MDLRGETSVSKVVFTFAIFFVCVTARVGAIARVSMGKLVIQSFFDQSIPKILTLYSLPGKHLPVQC